MKFVLVLVLSCSLVFANGSGSGRRSSFNHQDDTRGLSVVSSFRVHLIKLSFTGEELLFPTALAPISVGSYRPQLLNVVLDTGSFTPVINNASCVSCDGGQGPAFSPKDSTSFKDLNTTTSLAYGGFTAYGGIVQDYVNVASGLEASPFIFMLTNKMTFNAGQNTFADGTSGVLGMSLQAVPGVGNFTGNNTISVIATQLAKPVVSFYVDRGRFELPGRVQWGGSDQLVASDDIFWLHVLNNRVDHFIVVVTDVFTNGVSKGVCKSTLCLALFDTGGTVMSFQSTIPKQPSIVPCTDVMLLPNITVEFLSVLNGPRFNVTLQPRDYVLQNETYCQSTVISNGQDRRIRHLSHVIGMKHLAGTTDFLLLDFGIQFASASTLIFDYEGRRLGLAPK